MENKKLFYTTFFAFWILSVVSYIHIMSYTYDTTPLDLGGYLSKMLETLIFYKKNGLAIQYWSPSMGGGVPAYPNPQQTQFGIFQFLLFVFKPWHAFMIDIVISTSIGFLGAYLFFRNTLKVTGYQGLFLAVSFICIGFNIQHLIAGHVFFPLFNFLPMLLYLVFNKGLRSLLIGGLIIGFMINNAGFYPLFACSVAIIISLTLLLLLSPEKPSQFTFLNKVFRITAIYVFGFIIGFSKLVAMFYFMRHFERNLQYSLELSFWGCFQQLACQLFAFQGFGLTTNIIWMNALFGGYSHESDVSVPISILLITVFILVTSFSKIGNLFYRRFAERPFLVFILGILLISLFSITTTYGPLYFFFKSFPIIKSFSSVQRFTVCFAFILLVLCGFAMQKVSILHNRTILVSLMILNLIVFNVTYSKNAILYSNRDLDFICRYTPQKMDDLWTQIQDNSYAIRVDSIMFSRDPFQMMVNASSSSFSDPIFWSRSDLVTPFTKIGPVDGISDGYYNMTNPASLVYPEVNNLKKWERIKANDASNFENFRKYKPVSWKLPKLQIYSNYVSVIALFTSIIAILILFIKDIIT